jgi:hypothetical protein
MCKRVKCFMCLRKNVSGVGVQRTHAAPSQSWIAVLLGHLIFHEWNYGVDSSLSWMHAFQTNPFVMQFCGITVESQGFLHVLSFTGFMKCTYY